MKNLMYLLLLAGSTAISCSPSNSIFVKKTQHEKYADQLDKKDLDKTPEGRAWLEAANSSIMQPHEVKLPYSQKGIFHTDKPRALGLSFNARRGEKLNFQLQTRLEDGFIVYADIFKQGASGPELVLSGDTNQADFHFDVEETGTYIIRLQPQLQRTGEYELAVSTGPSLAFPVAGTKASIGSFWGDDRDGGKRSHEGIDIFAPKRTPVVAAADGIITAVRDGGIGGKTVWMRLADKNISLYYAHLDEQTVTTGQRVKTGETLGLVGNTGNARYTPPHLHFGIYTFQGAEDPIVFVNRTVKKAAKVPDKKLGHLLQLSRNYKIDGKQLKANTYLVPLAVTPSGYIAELPDGQRLQAPFSLVKTSKEAVSNMNQLALYGQKKTGDIN